MRAAFVVLACAGMLAFAACGREENEPTGQASDSTPSASGTEGHSQGTTQGSDANATTSIEAEPETWVTYRNAERGFSVRYPDDWYRASGRLTPNLGDPKEILSLGTYRLRVGGDRCAHHPVYALEDLATQDAFISVLERSPPYPANRYPPRPERFELPTERRTGRFCVPDDRRLDDWLFFSDGGRAFYLIVALGESASDDTKAEVVRVLNSLRFVAE